MSKLVFGFVPVLALVGCSGSTQNSVDATLTTAIDARPFDAATSVDAAALAACGAGPYMHYTGTTIIREKTGGEPPLADVAIRLDECPSIQLTSDAFGVYQIDLAKLSPMTFELTKPLYIPLILQTYQFPEIAGFDSFADTVSLRLASEWATPQFMPGFDSTHGYLLVSMGFSGPAPCDTAAGVVITLPNHPEATVHYMTGFPAMEDPTLMATDTSGQAYVSGITPGVLAEGDLVMTKSGCLTRGSKAYRIAAGAMTRALNSVYGP